MFKRLTLVTLMLLLIGSVSHAQEGEKKIDKGEFSGNFQTTNQFYVRDSAIGATTTQYQKELSSADAWLLLNYKIN